MYVTLMGGSLQQQLMKHTICSTGGSFEERLEYITIANVPLLVVGE